MAGGIASTLPTQESTALHAGNIITFLHRWHFESTVDFKFATKNDPILEC